MILETPPRSNPLIFNGSNDFAKHAYGRAQKCSGQALTADLLLGSGQISGLLWRGFALI